MANDLLAFSLIVILEVHCYLGQSLSRLKTVTMSSHNTNLVGSHAVDGNYNRDMSSCAGTSTDNLVDQWLEIDLGETTEFTRIVVYGQTSGELPRQNLIGLAVHLDGSETSVASIKDTSQGYVNYYHFDLGQKYSARRIKLILKGSNKVLVLCEVDVFNDSIISKGKHVTSISTLFDWPPSLAVDGDMRTNADVCSCCAETYLHTDPWLNVDLGETFLITYIQMFGRTDFLFRQRSLEGMNVTIDDVFIKTVPTSETFISYFDIVPIPETKGRNVRLTLTGEMREIVMCELVIYGGCPDGTFGSNCQHTCGMCACGQICDRATGECPNGCLEGYQGDACLLLTSVNEGTTISLPVYVGSMVAVACVTFAITFTIMFWRLRKTKESKSEREEAHTVREPSAAPLNEVASNYESLHLDNIRSESNYAELE